MSKVGNFLKYIWLRLRRNLGMKLLAVFLAVVLWNTVIINSDPMITRTTAPLPVTVIGTDQLSQNNLTLMNTINDYIDEVRVTVLMHRSQSKTFDENDVQVTLNLARITTIGEKQLKLSAFTSQGSIEKISPEYITVDVDQYLSKVVPAECEITGELSENYYMGNLMLEPNVIQVSGPASVVRTINRAHIAQDITDQTASILVPKEFELLTADNEVVSSPALSTSVSSVMINLPITPRKNLLIKSSVTGVDQLPPGYQIDSVEIHPDTVEVTGTAEILNEMTSIPTEVIDVAGSSADVSTNVKLLVPEGVSLLSAVDTATLLIRISEILVPVTFDNVPVEIRNVPAGLEIPDAQEIVRNITVLIPENTYESFTAARVKLFIDLEGLEPGEHTLKIQTEVSEEYRIQNIDMVEDNVTLALAEK